MTHEPRGAENGGREGRWRNTTVVVHASASIPKVFQAHSGYGKYETGRKPGPTMEVACWVHALLAFFLMADLAENARRKSPRQEIGSDFAVGARSRPDRRAVRERVPNQHTAEPGRSSHPAGFRIAEQVAIPII